LYGLNNVCGIQSWEALLSGMSDKWSSGKSAANDAYPDVISLNSYNYSHYKMDPHNMTVQDYLLKFRKISSLESLEKLFDHLNYNLTDEAEIINMYRAADHRRAELVSGGKLFDVGQVPKTVWRYVQ